jgi:hypothetical protein
MIADASAPVGVGSKVDELSDQKWNNGVEL